MSKVLKYPGPSVGMRIPYAHTNTGEGSCSLPTTFMPPKRAANLSINGDLLNKAKELDINLSATLEHALV